MQIHFLPAPAFILFCQLASSAGVVAAGSAFGVLDCDRLEWGKVQKFALVVVGFLACIFANIKVLQHANVETFITFRSSTPLVLSVCDYIFLGRSWPNGRAWACLSVLLLGACGYVSVDTAFKVRDGGCEGGGGGGVRVV
jgi:solute carrier family 35 protein